MQTLEGGGVGKNANGRTGQEGSDYTRYRDNGETSTQGPRSKDQRISGSTAPIKRSLTYGIQARLPAANIPNGMASSKKGDEKKL